jgi:glycosyltransferase involved in cell wall biosynthesis
LFCRSSAALFEEMTPLVDKVVVLQPFLGRVFEGGPWAITARRAGSFISAAVFQESSPEFARAAQREGVQTVYPACHSHARRLPNPIAWIPDLQHWVMPQFFSPLARATRNRRFSTLLENPYRHVVFSSHCALKDATAAYGPPRAKTHVLHFSTVPVPSWFCDPSPVVAKYGLPENFFIICNQFWIHKDHSTAFRAVSVLNGRGLKVHLVCTGPTHDNRHPDYFPKLLREIRELGIEQQVHILGTIPRVDQVALIRASKAVLQPSRFEGWSTVIEDARALGKPVIASDLPVHIEQAAPLSTFFRQGDAEHCALAVEQRVSAGQSSTDSCQLHNARIVRFTRDFMNIVQAACINQSYVA